MSFLQLCIPRLRIKQAFPAYEFLKILSTKLEYEKHIFLSLFALFDFKSMPPYISMNEHHPPNPIKQHHNIIEDRTHICLSHLYLAQYLNAQPISLGLFINWVSEEVPVPGKKKSF